GRRLVWDPYGCRWPGEAPSGRGPLWPHTRGRRGQGERETLRPLRFLFARHGRCRVEGHAGVHRLSGGTGEPWLAMRRILGAVLPLPEAVVAPQRDATELRRWAIGVRRARLRAHRSKSAPGRPVYGTDHPMGRAVLPGDFPGAAA